MSDVFTASNGFTFEPDGRGGLTVWSSPDRGVRFAPVPAQMLEALREFFAQEELGKPWHDARPGEVWSVKVKDWDVDRCFVFAPFEGPYRFQTETETHIPVTDERIVFAVRVYPEEES